MSRYIDPRNKALWHLDRLAELQRSGTTSAPVNVEIDLSNRCSLGCSWCHFAHTHTRGPLAGKAKKPAGAVSGGDLMDPELARRILGQLHAAGVLSVTWTGGGEPTLHPAFDTIVRHAELLRLQQGIYTHGGHIDASRADLLKRACTWVYVSLDECTADEYIVSKGVDRFERALGGIERLVAAPGSATVGVGYLLHRDNWRRVPDMVQLGRSIGADYVQFRPTVRYEQATPDQVAEDAAWVDGATGILRAYADDPLVLSDLDRFRMYAEWQGHGYATCHWAALQTVITPNGCMWRCVNKREHPSALLGDLSAESFSDVWARAGGACAVDGSCRIMCRGHVANVTLDAVIGQEPPHAAFV